MCRKVLKEYTLEEFLKKTEDKTSYPGGGAVAGYVGALGGALTKMAKNLTKDYEDKGEIRELEGLIGELLQVLEEDSKAFNGVLEAWKLPKETEEEKRIREEAVEKGYEKAIEVPLKSAKLALRVLEIQDSILGNLSSLALTDGGIGALFAYAALEGSLFNVVINLSGIKDPERRKDLEEERQNLLERGRTLRDKILEQVYETYSLHD